MYKIGDWISILDYLELPLETSGVYIIRNKVNGKEYVGKSVNVRKRIKSHVETSSGRYLYRAFAKYGLNSFEVCLYLIGTEKEVTELETLIIEERKTFVPGGYNMTLGGDGSTGYRYTDEMRAAAVIRQTGKLHSEETLAKMKASGGHRKGATMSEEAKAKISQGLVGKNLGRPVSKETREKIRIANTGKIGTPMTQEHKQKLSERNSGVVKPWLSEKLKGSGNPMFGKVSPNRRKIHLTESCGKETIFDSSIAAATYLGVNAASISDWCNGRYKTKLPIVIKFA